VKKQTPKERNPPENQKTTARLENRGQGKKHGAEGADAMQHA